MTDTKCPRCGLGIDSDGDGSCGICAHWTDEMVAAKAGPLSKVDDEPIAHDEAVARLQALGIYDQCAEMFGWAR